MSDIRTFITALGSAFGQSLTLSSAINPGSSGELAAQFAFSYTQGFSKTAADGAAATTTAATGFFWNPHPFPLYVTGASYVSQAGTVVADNANFATLNILTDNGAAGAPAAAAQRSTTIVAPGTGNIAAAIPTDLMSSAALIAANAAQRILVAGAGLWFSIGKSGTGVVIPIGLFNVVLSKF